MIFKGHFLTVISCNTMSSVLFIYGRAPFSLTCSRVALQALATTECTQTSAPGEQYGALCYDVGGCCPTASAGAELMGDVKPAPSNDVTAMKLDKK